MTATVIDGNKIADSILIGVATEIKLLRREPSLAVVRIGDDPASEVYINKKMKVCSQIGIRSFLYSYPSNISQDDLKKIIKGLNSGFDGILVQLPLPDHIDKHCVLNTIDPDKDVDCFTATNIGRLAQGNALLKPCTPSGILAILDYHKIQTHGKQVTIINRSQVVGQPLALMLQQEPYNATVTVCHEYTNNLAACIVNADIIVTAVGKYPKFKFPECAIKDGAAIIDVAMNRVNGKLYGDVIDFEAVKRRVKWITPVPGGVGPTTVAMLMKNTLTAAQLNRKKQ